MCLWYYCKSENMWHKNALDGTYTIPLVCVCAGEHNYEGIVMIYCNRSYTTRD